MRTGRHHYQAVIQAPFGALGISVQGGRLQAIDILPAETAGQAPRDAATRGITACIRNYLKDPRSRLDFEPLLEGTPFQQRVWSRLLRIPPGQTMTYGELARELGSSPRAVGNACRANPCPLVVPCHRVVARNGLGGFAGKTSGPRLRLKAWLLSHEGGWVDPSAVAE